MSIPCLVEFEGEEYQATPPRLFVSLPRVGETITLYDRPDFGMRAKFLVTQVHHIPENEGLGPSACAVLTVRFVSRS